MMAILAAFALELANNQSDSRSEIRTQIHDRAVLAASLIDSLFNTAKSQATNDSNLYGNPGVTGDYLDEQIAGTPRSQTAPVYLALLDSSGHLLARSSRLPAPQAADLPTSPAVVMALRGRVPSFGLGNYVAIDSGVIDYAITFPASDGTRVLVTGFSPSALEAFLVQDLRSIPGSASEVNYVVDSNGVVLASSRPTDHVGSVITQRGALAALAGGSPDRNGTYFEHDQLTSSTWTMVLAAPDGPLFASVTGLRQLVPWIIFAAFAVMAGAALLLGWRTLRAASDLRLANDQLGRVNMELLGANSALEQRAAELARSNAELDQFASIASHDLQEPLRKVRTFTEQLAVVEGQNLSEKGHDYLVRAGSAAERMQKLIEDLLRFSRVSTQGHPFTSVNLTEVARTVAEDLEPSISDTDAIVRIGDLPTVTADALQMQQLLQNLISNALKFTRPGVTPEVVIDASTVDGQVRLTVRDNGIGFDPRYAERIFRIFERLHGRSEYPGTGIGLSLCRKIVDRHGGSISADGFPGEGSLFTVVLPIDTTAAEGPDPGAATVAPVLAASGGLGQR